jgi:hypothetical protein
MRMMRAKANLSCSAGKGKGGLNGQERGLGLGQCLNMRNKALAARGSMKMLVRCFESRVGLPILWSYVEDPGGGVLVFYHHAAVGSGRYERGE